MHRLLSSGPFVLVGKASYSFYLWHFPLFAFAVYLLNRSLDPVTGLLLSVAALALMGATDMVSVYVRSTLIQLRTPDELRGRGMLAEYEHPAFGAVRSVGLPLTLGAFEPSYAPGPALGADGAAILIEAGYDAAAIEALRAAGAFGSGTATPDEASDPA